jgi:hypothetical protein
MPLNKNYYKVLGVPRGASQTQIEEAWKNWRRDPKNHPDTHSDLKDKERVEHQFQEHSAAYLVLNSPVERRKHDAELDARAEEAKKTSGPTPPPRPTTKQSTAGSQNPYVHGFNSPDPSSETADWGGERGTRPQWQRRVPAQPIKSSSGPASLLRYLRLTPLLILASALVVLWIFYIALSPHPVPDSGLAGPIEVQNTPSSNPDPGIVAVTPSPSATPSATPSPTPTTCPSGSPEIRTTGPASVTQNSNGNYTYVVYGKITNPTNDDMQIGPIGFYVGSADTNSPPTWTDTLANMTISPDSSNPDVVPANSTVSFTENQTVQMSTFDGTPSSNVSATLDYPSTDNGQMQSNWQFVSGSCDDSND